ncbi:MAG: tRNA lysidine(34) synthetase TilS, partial [Opitutus sp.]
LWSGALCSRMPVRKQIDWRAVAAALAERLPLTRLHPKVTSWVADSRGGGSWAVAFSGGADSLAVLLLVWAHWPERRKRIIALHFNHCLRGAASTRDQQFCERVARSLGIRCAVGYWKDAPRDASEGQSRRARHAFFSSELKRRRTSVIWLGHQQDDIAETMLMRLARGSGAGGLAAPRSVQVLPEKTHVRPLLTVSKQELTSIFTALKVPWREDATNRGRRFLRNRMRHDVLPAWRDASIGRDAVAGAALSRELLEEDDEALDEWADRAAVCTKTGAMNLRKLSGVPRAVVRRALHRWIATTDPTIELSRQAFHALLDDLMAQRQRRHSLGHERFAVVGATRLVFERVRRNVSN